MHKLTFPVLLLLWVSSGEQTLLGESRWPQFRGSNGRGVAEGKPLVEFGPPASFTPSAKRSAKPNDAVDPGSVGRWPAEHFVR